VGLVSQKGGGGGVFLTFQSPLGGGGGWNQGLPKKKWVGCRAPGSCGGEREEGWTWGFEGGCGGKSRGGEETCWSKYYTFAAFYGKKKEEMMGVKNKKEQKGSYQKH